MDNKTMQWTTIHKAYITLSKEGIKRYNPRGRRSWTAWDYLNAHMMDADLGNYDPSGEIIYGCASEEEAIAWATARGLMTSPGGTIIGGVNADIYWAETYIITDERDEREAGDMCPGDILEEIDRPWVAPLEPNPYRDDDEDDDDDDDEDDDEDRSGIEPPARGHGTQKESIMKEQIFDIGTFRVESGTLMILDPLCDGSAAIRVENVRTGEWSVRVNRREWYGVKSVEMACGEDDGGSQLANTLELIAETATAAAVDADALMDALGPEDERVRRFLALTGGETGASVLERGMTAHTGEGDGSYPVCIYRDGDGRACRIVMIF